MRIQATVLVWLLAVFTNVTTQYGSFKQIAVLKQLGKYSKATCKGCKGGVVYPEVLVQCNDNHVYLDDCVDWAKTGECEINPVWMSENCRKSCFLCGDEDKTVANILESGLELGSCGDIYDSLECSGWADLGECQLNPDWMIPNCRKSCKKCHAGGDGDYDMYDTDECNNLWDDRQCEVWSRDQECTKNRIWMNIHCHKACSQCSFDDGNINNDGDTCVNHHNSDTDCNTWAKFGHCEINNWMLAHCAKACQSCTTVNDVYTPRTMLIPDNSNTFNTMNKMRECYDTHQLCPVWTLDGQCQSNSEYMLRHCQNSCRVC